MGSFSIWHWLIVIIVVMLLFGRGKVSDLMGDFAKGINSFKKGLADDGTPTTTVPPSQLTQPVVHPAPPASSVHPVDAPRT